jgi:Rrf2 family transcriptional regulator, iron-sulfur cluster assembly transcription factor
MISTTSKYALSVLRLLAERPDETLLGRDIARATGIPANYLAKVMSRLCKAGFVEGRKGWGGGFSLAAAAGQRPLIEVLNLFDGSAADGECVFGLRQCNSKNPCPLHDRWERVRGCFRDTMTRTRVRDLTDRRRR